MTLRRVLFVCSCNRLRSPTAEHVFRAWPSLETESAGLADEAEVPVSGEQLAWAELIVVMSDPSPPASDPPSRPPQGPAPGLCRHSRPLPIHAAGTDHHAAEKGRPLLH